MVSKSWSLANLRNQEYGYGLAYRLACEQVAGIDDIEKQCLNSGTRCEVIGSRKIIVLEYLNHQYQIAFPDIEISLKDSREEVPLRDKILMLHYLAQAKGIPISNKVITYKELPDSGNYFPVFFKRAIKPLIDHFGKEPTRLLDIAGIMGGVQADHGDVSITINAFSRVPITLVLWRGDEELPPGGSILFDSSISDYLTADDVNALCETIAWRLVKLLRAGGDSAGRS